jgi:hypothetical protein
LPWARLRSRGRAGGRVYRTLPKTGHADSRDRPEAEGQGGVDRSQPEDLDSGGEPDPDRGRCGRRQAEAGVRGPEQKPASGDGKPKTAKSAPKDGTAAAAGAPTNSDVPKPKKPAWIRMPLTVRLMLLSATHFAAHASLAPSPVSAPRLSKFAETGETEGARVARERFFRQRAG